MDTVRLCEESRGQRRGLKQPLSLFRIILAGVMIPPWALKSASRKPLHWCQEQRGRLGKGPTGIDLCPYIAKVECDKEKPTIVFRGGKVHYIPAVSKTPQTCL